MMYASKISIDPVPQIIHFKKEINLGYDIPHLTMSDLVKYGITEDDSFTILKEDNSQYILIIYSIRTETNKEVEKRIADAIAYNERYDAFHKKYSKIK